MEGLLVGVTKIRDDYTWRLIGNATKQCTSYMWNVARNSNLNFVENTPPHPGVVLWIRIGGVKHMRQNAVHTGAPEHAQPVWQGCPLTLGSKPL